MDDSEYEKQRQINIAKNRELLKQLQLDSLSPSIPKRPTPAKSTPSKKSTTRVKKERPVSESSGPRRTSSRLAGLPADSEVAKRKAEDQEQAFMGAERAKRARVAGDLSFEIKEGLLDGVGKHDRTFTDEDVKKTGDKGLRAIREELMGLKLWEKFEPSQIKITPERIYHLEFHPTTDKPLIFAADKIGNLGILNVSSSDDDEPDISSYKLHARTISTFFVAPTSAESLYTSSYDATIRCLDLNSGKSVEVFVHPEEDPLSSVCALDDACNTLLYSTLSGEVGRFDTRAPGKTETWQCSDKKIGGMHVLPTNRNFFATASLDRTVKIWDLRNAATPVSEHTSRLSVSAAQWSKTGKLATTSYDDTVKIYNPKLPLVSVKREDVIKLEEGVKRQESVKKEEDTETIDLEPEHVIRHNCQTGRWVTILRAVWQDDPIDSVQKLVVANMNRGIDVFGENGEQLAQLKDDNLITAVPAVARAHPRQNWIAGGTGSGKIVLWM